MRERLRKLLTLTLTASMVLSMSTAAFAEEYNEDAVIMEVQESDSGEFDEKETSEYEASDLAGIDSVDEITIDAAEGSADAEVGGSVSDPSADPETWSTDPKYAKYTYGIYLPELFDLNDRDMISDNWIYNGEKTSKEALTGDDLGYWYDGTNIFDEYGLVITSSGKAARVSFNCVPLGSSKYFVYAYGIANEFDWANSTIRNWEVEGEEAYAVSRNNYYGLAKDGSDYVPAGVFDYTKFTWYEKDGGSGANGNIVFEGAVINWSSGKKAEKNRLYKVDKLKTKYNLYATVSFDAVDGKWKEVENNKFQKSSKQPFFYPVLVCRKSYRTIDGVKIKPTKEDKKFLRTINDTLKARPINFEIRRRPMAGTTSENYIYGNSWRYTSLMGDDLDFKSSGKLKKATLQFKSTAYVNEKDNDSDDFDNEEAEAGTENTTSQVAGYYLTHVLKMKKIKDSEVSSTNLESNIKAGNSPFKAKTDSWYTTKTIAGYDTLIVYGANNMEGVAAFRKRKDTTVGSGFYKDEKNMFIQSVNLDEIEEAE